MQADDYFIDEPVPCTARNRAPRRVLRTLDLDGGATLAGMSVSPPAGWLPDPNGRHELRYWDGAQWTDNVSDGGVVSKHAYDPAAIDLPPPPEGVIVPAAASSTAAERPTESKAGAMAPVAAAPAAGAVSSRDRQEEELTLWEGQTENLQALASKGKIVIARYRVTNQAVYFETGLVSSKHDMVVLASVTDAHVTQDFLQKRRGVGNVVVEYQPADGPNASRTMDSVRDPITLRDLILQHARYEAQRVARAQRTIYGGLADA